MQSSRYQDLFYNFCSRFVEYIRFSLSAVTTEDLLNWVRLIVYIESSRHLQWVLKHLCTNAAPEERNGASLRKLLANEEFQSYNKFKAIREHPILAEWRRQQQKKSFAILFSRRRSTGSRKRKLTMEDAAAGVIPKRAKSDAKQGKCFS